MPLHAPSIFMFPGHLLLAAVRAVGGGTFDTSRLWRTGFSWGGKLAFSSSILVCATHSLFRVPGAVGKPAQHVFEQGHCGLSPQRTACASSCPRLMLWGNEPATSSPQMRTFVVVQFVAAQLLDVPTQRREDPPAAGSIPRWCWAHHQAKAHSLFHSAKIKPNDWF